MAAAKSAEALWAEYEARKGNASGRVEDYHRMSAPYFGGDWARQGRGEIISNFADGRAALKFVGSGSSSDGADANYSQLLNMIPEIVDSIVAVRGVVPSHEVSPESGDPQEIERALKRTRALREQYIHSGMVTQGAMLAFFLASMGDSCLVLNPRVPADLVAEKEREGRVDPFRPLGVYISVVNPAHAFPRFRAGGFHQAELEDVFTEHILSAQDASDAWGVRSDRDEVTVVHYYGRREKRILVEPGKDVIPPVEHELGFCPAVWVRNKAVGRDGQSDIRMAIPINRQLAVMYALWLDAAIWAIHPIIHVHDREYVTTEAETMEVGPGSTVSTVQTGNVQLISPAGRPEVAGAMMEILVQSLHQVSGVSPIQTQGIIDRSNVSARSVDRQMSPMETRLQLSNLLLSESYELLNGKILLMLSSLPDFKRVQFPLFGEDSKGAYNDSFTSQDIGGWIRTKTRWDPAVGTSRHEIVAMLMQLFKESMVTPQPYRLPFKMLLEAAGVEDPELKMQEAIAEWQESQKVLKEAQPPGPPGMPPGMPPGGHHGAPGEAPHALREASALQQGGLEAAGPPGGGAPGPPGGAPGPVQPPAGAGGGLQMPGFAPIASAPTRPGIGNAPPVPDVGQIMAGILQTVHLHEPVADVRYHGGPNHTIVVTVSDFRDVAILRQAMQNLPGGLRADVSTRSPKKTGAGSNGRHP
jgi:hypothetical protein